MRIKWFSLIRITGLICVLLYHFFQMRYTGGFIGVDIFFTFSGYLITALIIDEFSKTKKFSLHDFYYRRVMRIVPPLILMICVVLPFTLLVGRDYITDLTRQIAAALGFVTNIFEINTGGTYESRFIPHLFVHTWSLAIEVQFYLLWGLCLYLLTKYSQTVKQFRWRVFGGSFALATISALAMYLRAKQLTEFSPIYFSSVTHIFPFFIGSMLGAIAGIQDVLPQFSESFAKHWTKKWAAIFMGVNLGCLFILAYCLRFSEQITYMFGFLLASLFAAGAIFGANVLHRKTPDIKEPQIFTYLADISYSVYLFHWPLFVILSKRYSNWGAALLTTILAVIFASFSYYFLEPLLRGKDVAVLGKTFNLKQVLAPLGIFTTLAVGFGVYLCLQAPTISSLEQNLLLGGIQQDVTKLETAYAKATAPKVEQQLAQTQTADQTIPEGTTIIGDSVTLGSRSYLLEHMENVDIDAEGNRTMNLAYDVLMNLQNTNQLRQNVVICIGTNALDDYQEQTQKVIDDLKDGHHLIFITPHDGNADSSYNSYKLGVWERTLPKKYNFITIGDWDEVARAHPEAFEGTDGTHFGGREDTSKLYLDCIQDALKRAQKTPLKGEK
ncbi:acyltransferase family protein [Ligilactobacillus apodemi]|uniref:Acyltransferase n=1 Tax=Ligilactobacillus apodemi DSM 16634 = JCM 16172 TaxID=1423724 RepID=A0A0R1U1P5_9LACO|nr:acyltransferase family protein [Ligilactobacillus apodemi]KRL84789.1 acyltransferase [Ligilactobacillus apodemi DSM 16634 = JCM 16172]MCR1901109.1 acyltransferase [Ligilactobacillus apodemi]